jgi:RNA polymerase sigma factor (sigma-70 family)
VDHVDTDDTDTRAWTAESHVTALYQAHALESAEATVLLGEEHRAVLAAIRRLPARQREALVLRYYLDMTENQAADAMRVSRGTVKSATSRAIAAVGRMLREES